MPEAVSAEHRALALFGALLLALPAPGLAEAPGAGSEAKLSPTAAFLFAADRDDQPAMLALLGMERLPTAIRGCYLRRVYRNDESGEVMGGWMCAEGEKASRVVLATIADHGDGVIFEVAHEARNARPAPPRTGSALADAPAPAAPQ
jgi:hypothetical protein